MANDLIKLQARHAHLLGMSILLRPIKLILLITLRRENLLERPLLLLIYWLLAVYRLILNFIWRLMKFKVFFLIMKNISDLTNIVAFIIEKPRNASALLISTLLLFIITLWSLVMSALNELLIIFLGCREKCFETCVKHLDSLLLLNLLLHVLAAHEWILHYYFLHLLLLSGKMERQSRRIIPRLLGHRQCLEVCHYIVNLLILMFIILVVTWLFWLLNRVIPLIIKNIVCRVLLNIPCC